MSLLEFLASLLLTLAVHASLALALAWLLEATRLLRHPDWRELAWRAALFGALLSTGLTGLRWLEQVETPARAQVATSAPGATAALPSGPANGASAPTDPGTPASPATARASGAATPASARPIEKENQPGTAYPGVLVSLPDQLAMGLLMAGCLASAWALLRLLGQLIQLRRLARRVRRHGRAASGALASGAEALARRVGLRTPGLTVLPGLSSPMLMPRGRLLLPEWAESLPVEQQQALLAHEFAHLQRRDPALRLLHRLAALPLAWHPLARLALRRLDALAEDQCDARAAAWLGSGRPLAECLAHCLAHAGPDAGHPTLAVAMAAEPGPVVRRVRNLLENPAMPLRPLSPTLRRGAWVLGLAALVSLPGIAIGVFAGNALAGVGESILSSGDSHRYRSDDGDTRIDLRLRGKVAFTADETDVESLGEGARFSLSVDRDGVEREFRVARRDGALQRQFLVDGREKPFDAAARAWLATELPLQLAQTGVNAEARGKRLLAEGGVPALLDAIDALRADHATRAYVQVLVANARLEPAQAMRLVDRIVRMESDYERRSAAVSLLEHQPATPALQARLLEVAAALSSDYEARLLLEALVRQGMPAPGTEKAWRQALAGLSSDYEQRLVLEALLARAPADARTLALVLESSAGIDSDYEARLVLEAIAPRVAADPSLAPAFGAALARIGSDYEQRQVLETLLARPVDAAGAGLVLDQVASIGSDHEASLVLRKLAAVMPADDALIARYRNAARRLSDHERGQAEKALDRFQ